MKKIAALFVEKWGCYSNLDIVDLWDINRDARNYDGPFPVVAHPPCQLWGRFAKINFIRWGGDHNQPGNDGGCFLSALNSVKKFGGVLEHPADTYAFETYGLPKPKGVGWNKISETEWVCEVWQSAYGHLARKRTWLFYKGINPPMELNWERKKGIYQIGGKRKRGQNLPTLSGKKASATPILFRDALIELAFNSNI